MTKQQAVEMFGKQKLLVEYLGITRQAFDQWKDPLPQDRADRILGAYMRFAEDRDKKITHILSK